MQFTTKYFVHEKYYIRDYIIYINMRTTFKWFEVYWKLIGLT